MTIFVNTASGKGDSSISKAEKSVPYQARPFGPRGYISGHEVSDDAQFARDAAPVGHLLMHYLSKWPIFKAIHVRLVSGGN